MNAQTLQWHEGRRPVAAADQDTRATFIGRTYGHLFGSIVAFTLLEVLYFQLGWARPMAEAMLSVSWLLVLGGFMVVGWLASRVAFSNAGPAVQYAALLAFVAAESLIFVPLLWIANAHVGGGVIESAAAITLGAFTLLTAIVFFTRKDFSFLRTFLVWGGVVALVLIVAAVLFGMALGTWFFAAMVVFAGAAILYDTSNVLHHFPEDRYVAASLQLFASVALMFWYVLMLVMASRD